MAFPEEDRKILYHVPLASGIEKRLGLTLLRVGKGKAKPRYWRSMVSKDVYTVKLVVSGRGSVQTRTGEHGISAGDVVFFWQGHAYTWRTDPNDLLSHYWIDFEGSMAQSLFDSLPLSPDACVLRRSAVLEREIACFERLIALYEDPAPHGLWAAMAIFFELWHSIQASGGLAPGVDAVAPADSAGLARRAKTFIDTHFTEDIRMEDISGSVNVTPEYLSLLFRQEYGMPPYEYVIERRLNAATKMLREGATVKEAAASVGYLDPGYFARLYRRKRGVSPSAIGRAH